MGDSLTLSPVIPATTFHRFSELATEVRHNIWYHTLLEPCIILAKVHRGASLLPVLPRFPPSVLALLHTNHEARSEILNRYQLLRFPVLVSRNSGPKSEHSRFCHKCQLNGWPAPKCGKQRHRLEMRWESRGCFTLDVRSDIVFFGRWSTKDLQITYGKDFSLALVFALSEVRFLSISMHSWRETRVGWLKVLRSLGKLDQVVFVRELLECCNHSMNYRLLGLAEVAVAEHEFSGELWKSRILLDIDREKQVWPEWRVPKLVFKAITDKSEVGRQCDFQHPRKLKRGNSWRT